MKAIYSKGLSCLNGVCSLVKVDNVLCWLDGFVDVFLDDITREVIRKYEANLRRTFREEGASPSNNFQMKMIGIKLFILYQKGVKVGRRIKDRLVGECKVVLNSFDDTLQTFKKNFWVRESCIYIALGWSIGGKIVG
jgi:hypothetical protein